MATRETIEDGSTGSHNTSGGYCDLCENKPCTYYIDNYTILSRFEDEAINSVMIAHSPETDDGQDTVGVDDGGEWPENPSRVIDGDGSLVKSLLGEDGMDEILPNLLTEDYKKKPLHTYGPSCFAGSCLGGVCSKAVTQDSSHKVAGPGAPKYNNLLLVFKEPQISYKTFTAKKLVPNLKPKIVTCKYCGFAIKPEENHKCTKPL